ncbi:MAG: hypothetical protein AAF597_19370, partial [Bacteroidota bacterium]
GLAWLYWSIKTPRWKLKAFSVVSEKDWLRLYRTAVRTKLIWPMSHRYERTEIRTLGTHEMLTYIDEKLIELRQIEAVNDDFITSAEVIFKADRRAVWWLLLPVVFLLSGGPYVLLTEGVDMWMGWFGLGLGIFLLVRSWRYFLAVVTGSTVLSLTEQGLKYTLYERFIIQWEDVQSISVVDNGAKLEVTHWREGQVKKSSIDLASLEFSNRNGLLRYMHTFLERSQRIEN